MRESTRQPSPDAPATERVPLRRLALWTALAVLLLVGVALTFLFGRGMLPLL